VDLLTNIGLLMVGFLIGNLIVSRVALWVGAVLEILESSSQGWRMAVAASLFIDGPWMLLVFGVFAYFVRSEPWAPWLIGGAVAALAFFGSFTFIIIRKQRRANPGRTKAQWPST
jgi:hypothetical protein